MKSIFQTLIVGLYLHPALAQKQKHEGGGHYLSVRVAVVAPLGVFDNNYYGGLGLNGTMHFKWLSKGAEVQMVTGYEKFLPKKGNIFGAISTIPFKIGILQMISKEFYLYVRAGVLTVKDQQSSFSFRFSTDAGLGYAFPKFAVDIGFHGWARKAGGYSNYFSAGLVVPFHR